MTGADYPEPKIEMLAVGSIATDHQVQRHQSRSHIEKIKSGYRRDGIGILTLSRREDGTLWYIDGQHRGTAMFELGLSSELVTCEVYEGLTLAQEGELFLKLNNSKNVSIVDKFRVRVTTGDPVAVDMARIAGNHGLKITGASGEGQIAAIAAAESVYTGQVAGKNGSYQAVFAMTLSVLIEAFGREPDAMSGQLVRGVGLFIHKYGKVVVQNGLAKKIASHPGGAEGLIGAGKNNNFRHRLGGVHKGICFAVLDDYNRGRRKDTLPAA
jgi:hypothetical protein